VSIGEKFLAVERRPKVALPVMASAVRTPASSISAAAPIANECLLMCREPHRLIWPPAGRCALGIALNGQNFTLKMIPIRHFETVLQATPQGLNLHNLVPRTSDSGTLTVRG
jgi:hypothetical protein